MNHDIFITCAVTGAGDTAGRSPNVPVTPMQTADAAIEAAVLETVGTKVLGREAVRGKLELWRH